MTGKIDFDRVLESLAGRTLIGFKHPIEPYRGAAEAIDKEDQAAAGHPALLKSTTAKRGVKP
jgi:hypothetical protein